MMTSVADHARLAHMIVSRNNSYMRNTKETLRGQLLSLRRQMTEHNARALSRAITDRVISTTPWQNVRTIHIYQPLQKYREVDTTALITFIQDNYPNIAIASWRKQGTTYSAYWLADNTPVPAKQPFDVIIVPLLGFTGTNHRLGFGGGFYDRFLATQQEAKTIGLCYNVNQIAFEPEPHDIPLQFIVTETRSMHLQRYS
jgi:5-formyltetrahydrofolate cyclo-ligase